MKTLLLSTTLLAGLFQLGAANVVTDWNSIASTTIVSNGGKASVASGVWFAYTSIAVYDAVHHQRFQPFYYSDVAPDDTSDEAAATPPLTGSW
jgi:hypothetical protein